MNDRTGDILLASIIFIFTLTILLLGEYHWEYSPNVIMFPWMAGILVAVSTVWLLVRSCIVSTDLLAKEGESIAEASSPRSSLLKRILWLASVYPLCYVLGIVTGLLIYTLAYTSFHHLPWWQRILALAIVLLVSYGGFYLLLGVPIPLTPLWMREY